MKMTKVIAPAGLSFIKRGNAGACKKMALSVLDVIQLVLGHFLKRIEGSNVRNDTVE